MDRGFQSGSNRIACRGYRGLKGCFRCFVRAFLFSVVFYHPAFAAANDIVNCTHDCFSKCTRVENYYYLILGQ